MANYKIVIKTNTAGDLSSGYSSVGNDTDAVIDRGAGRNTSRRILSAKFGDGYEQRVLDGINNIEETYSISFKNRAQAEINTIADFLDDQPPAPFQFYIGDDTVYVICDSYSISYGHDSVYSLSAQFRRVYQTS
jgi:phage-related protein